MEILEFNVAVVQFKDDTGALVDEWAVLLDLPGVPRRISRSFATHAEAHALAEETSRALGEMIAAMEPDRVEMTHTDYQNPENSYVQTSGPAAKDYLN